MSVLLPDPKSPQDDVTVQAGNNKTARPGAYTDQALTTRNATGTAPASDLPADSGSTTLGGTRPVYAADKAEEIDNTDGADNTADAPPNPPNSWQMQTRGGSRRSRDPYAANGQDQYLQNN